MDDAIVREIMNGMWFILSIEMWLALLFYLIRKIVNHEGGEKYIISPHSWYDDPGIQLAIALLVYITGSGMRAGWVWMWLECENEWGRGHCAIITSTVWPLLVASIFAVVGGVCAVRILVPFGQPWNWLSAGSVAVSIPFIFHIL